MENQLEWFDKEYVPYREMLREAMGDVAIAHADFRDKVYRDGALSTKVKRLMAMCVALSVGCPGCMVGQTKAAIENGATKEDVVEAFQVVLAVRGTTAYGWSSRITKLLEDMGMW
jgi:AhpD family alkylhydroperoxidase